ncbi:GNAT family N-acetyltransferase [Paraburkholderia hospita]|uniref:GNAT family N-acetyltransferase n=1 Tax=Paraburkholderia hospita TaxID=169430 RepID=UPI0008A7F1BA|nr:GNAT family protein [Paraburkholderia hospita]SEH89895.1 Protein N-acetyltransferase, RimJ/RimL family [Paraburkholderia hospita]
MVRISNHFSTMFKLIYEQDERFLTWAAARIGVDRFRDDARTIAYEKDGELLAVIVFDGFSGSDMNMHVASDGTRQWLTRELLTAAFAYPFIQCGVRRVTGLVPAKNAAALKFDQHLGFRREGYHPCAARNGGDLISLGMLREHCRFLPQGTA